ncbi:hypothetical protein WDJ51_08415 [Rathayibacter sp. YIM 133350]|uniref:hypothetical protein n=1 Tax=Rathayibacter sp. YIM 133350 TaxID=3131992 RepID=UPI00307E9F2E
MNTQLLTARDTRPRVQQYSSTALDRLARRTGLALVRWSSRSAGRPELSSEGMQLLHAAENLRRNSQRDTQMLVLLSRSQF